MKYSGGIQVTTFSRQDFIYISAFGLSSFLQAIVVTIQGPSYGIMFQANYTLPVSNNPFDITNPAAPAASQKVNTNTGTIPLPVSPFITKENDFAATFFGFLLGFYNFFSFILTPIIGIYIEGLGMKRIYMYGIVIAALSPFFSIILTFFPQNGIGYFLLSFVVRGVEAVGGVGMQIAIYMMISLLFPGRIATIFALNQAMTVFGVAFGGPVVFLIQKFGGFALPSTTFLTTGLIFIGFVAIVDKILPDLPPRNSLNITLKELLTRFYYFLKVPPILLFEVAIIITGIGNAFLQSILPPDLQYNLQVDAWGVALIPLLPALLQLLSPIWGYALDRIPNEEIIALIGSTIAIISLTIIGPLPFFQADQTLALTCIGLISFGLGQGAIVVSSYVLLISLSNENGIPNDMITTTIISTSFVAAISFGNALSSILSGIFYDDYGFQTATLFPFSLYTILGLLICLYSATNHRSELWDDEKNPLLDEVGYYFVGKRPLKSEDDRTDEESD